MLCVNYLFLVVILSSQVFSAKILGVFLYPSKQREILGTTLLAELAARGHEVMMISTYSQAFLQKKFPHVHVNRTEREPKYPANLMSLNMSTWEYIWFSNFEMRYMIADLLEDVHLQTFLNSGQQFEVVILDLFAEALLGISHQVNATTISFNPAGGSVVNYLSGNPTPYSYVPNEYGSFSDNMSFWKRFANTYIHLFHMFCKHFFNIPIQRRLLRNYFPNAPALENLIDSVDLHLVNSNYLFETPRPYLPNVVQIGGFHLQKPELLTVELLRYLDELKNGIILFTVGSHRQLGDFKVEIIETLFASFGQSTHNVLVQYDGAPPSNVPLNVRLMPWLPQRAVLSHRNTRLFITLGGRSSFAEAVYFAVPMIGLHVPGDDDSQLRLMTTRGCGVRFRMDESLETEALIAAMRDVVADPAYKLSISLESELFKRQEMNPLDKATYWIEHVAKRKVANRAKSHAAATMSLYKYVLLDIVVASMMMLIVSAIIWLRVLKYMFKVLLRLHQTRSIKYKSV